MRLSCTRRLSGEYNSSAAQAGGSCGRGRHQMREVANRNLALRTDVVDAQPFSLLQHPDELAHEIIDVDEGARLLSRALNGKIEHARRLPFAELLDAQHELRDHVLAP